MNSYSFVQTLKPKTRQSHALSLLKGSSLWETYTMHQTKPEQEISDLLFDKKVSCCVIIW